MKPILIASDTMKSHSYAKMFMDDNWETYTLPMFTYPSVDFPVNLPSYMFIIIPDIYAAYSMRHRLKDIVSTNLVCIGEDTERVINKYTGRGVDVVLSSTATDATMAAMERLSMAGDTIFFAAGSCSISFEITEFFKKKRVSFESPEVYVREAVNYPHGYINDYLKMLRIKDILLLTPIGARAFIEQPGLDLKRYNYHVVGETTANCLETYGVETNVCLKADPRSVRGAIWSYWKSNDAL